MLNQICIAGRLVRDPELRKTQTGVSVTSFTIAVDRDFSSKDGEKEADFVDVVCWRSTADFVDKYFSKGRMAVVSGRLQTRNWTDKEGNKRKAVEVIAENVYFGDSKKAESSGNTGSTYSGPGVDFLPESDFAEVLDDEEMPF